MEQLRFGDCSVEVHGGNQPAVGGSTPAQPLHFIVDHIDHTEAARFIEKWHYSKRTPTGMNIFLGGFVGTELYAVADYGKGVNPYQAPFLEKLLGVPMPDSGLLELKRLCRKEPKDDNAPLTQFLSICHRILRKMGYCAVIAFSDPEQGHTGGIYKAANFVNLGTTNPERKMKCLSAPSASS